MAKPIMLCGHAANAVNSKGEPACAICIGIDPGAEVVAAPHPAFVENLSKRTARCTYYGSVPSGRNHEGNCKRGQKCMCEVPSSSDLAFFEYTPDKQHDSFYCGCWGWD